MSILSFHNVSLNLAGKQILDNANLQIQVNERIALVGRNGAGKSTLLKLLLGELVQDSGQIQKQSGLKIAGLSQEVPTSRDESVYHFLVHHLGEKGEAIAGFHESSIRGDADKIAYYQQQVDQFHAWDLLPKIDALASHLELNKDALMSELSGGMKRRALLAAALIAEPGLLILDEPTNHLDIYTIEWLEAYLKQYNGSLLLVTHDRAFLSQVTKHIIEIDRGQLKRYECDYETYLDRKEAARLSEEKQSALFDKRLSEEEAWLRQGIKARRTRNEGRVRALKAMREAYKKRRNPTDKVERFDLEVNRSGKLVLEANHIHYSLHGKPLIQDFSLLLMRGDKVGIIGPNGSGKTTLIQILLGVITPEKGELRHGTALEVAYFDQLRRSLDPNQSVMANVAEGADYVTVNGKQKHVASYLKEFLFPTESFTQPVSTLSGGERNRLLLAKLFAKPVNLLVMDEPTNDLDLETLELLESMLMDYPGTLLLISHDRTFINHVVTSVLIYEGDGHFNEYVGGYDDYQQQRAKKQALKKETNEPVKQRSTQKLSFNEQRELSKLPQQIETLEQKIANLQAKMAMPSFYQQDTETIAQISQQLTQDEAQLAFLYQRWEELEERT
ncbi:ATP-binding cassette domain-containing protein [Legionella impletisoli]|uniref:ATP-binding protein Uup n=1 Tax=Legionella impletisoli TaxID=343510 RepID=A0A917JUD7_9GAMM|nr:ATP-binding cassette domain-containing protein [Legionella impletisoli]GGI85827.1 ABC transporter ATP-binding protein [Legionella impletisoli]